MRLLYSMALTALLLLTFPWWLLRMLREDKYRAGLGERLGRVPARLAGSGSGSRSPTSIWVHAVSVGEVLAASPLITQLRQRFPQHRVVISTTTATGQKLARSRFGEEHVFYFPLDFVFAIRAYLRTLRPELVVLVETEFWPNFLRLSHAWGAAIAVVNARVSDRSFPRYRAGRVAMRRILRAVDVFLAQSAEDGRRLVEIGAASERVAVSGNLKFDISRPPEAAFLAVLRAALLRSGAGGVAVCGSTLAGEEEAVVQAFRGLLPRHPNLVMVLAPRHPERFAAVAELLRASGIRFWQRSQWTGEQEIRAGILLLDSIGELASVYALAQVAFVGGSLVPRGGHNILEPAQYSVPIIVGPHTENFRDIVALFRRANAVVIAQDAADLERHLGALLDNDETRRLLGERAAGVLRQHAGATARTLEALQDLLDRRSTASCMAPGVPAPP